MYVRPCCSCLAQQICVEALVDDTEKTDARVRYLPLYVRLGKRLTGFSEMRDVNAAREQVNASIMPSFRVIETLTAGKNDSGLR
ncbi:hypothetical protein AWB74_08714 [Caballeronia arvi]|uniref:Uncharacterized protein n=1 Tax=Caballeronia arvi TaxID=1777135 RepID=A0A158L708_9BURK|nr:hypothetical protein AWB74_08714 [Caballeronia arvi]